MGRYPSKPISKSAQAKLSQTGRSPSATSSQQASTQTAKVLSYRSEPVRNRWSWVWLTAIALSTIIGAGSLSWLSFRLIVNPQSVKWLNHWVPGWQVKQEHDTTASTLDQIKASLNAQGWQAGEVLELGKSQSVVDGKTSVTDVLLPVIQSLWVDSPLLCSVKCRDERVHPQKS